ncbi:PHD FINGER PROTEIN, putative [Babesia bigemina]|uniref:PHD FINGER PROTEIN, putative n=1 Tax=Babesia bigemina TaxID=5866 RepID=A0A061D9W1_BABBI|nr:PHD FINGER PROTEIN, putative [Babesia bigemina]CDR94530.1 PHD FINGER PROTEIN, putative [Babesia bigemina]|eukprot:XP_012766716.1 PHD FINGER PROTEIN, putative [Babesia bigemina]
MNVRETAQSTATDLGCSFEGFLLSHYEEIYHERRLPCVVCKKMAPSSYVYDGQSIDCHGKCLAFVLFYYFMHFYDVAAPAQSREAGEMPNLTKLYKMPFQLLNATEYKRHCVFCGARSAFFKCSSENCLNHYHLSCNTNATIVVHHGKTDSKKPCYRFLFCQVHMNSYEVDLVNCRFNSKISLLEEYELLKKGTVPIKDPTPAEPPTPIPSPVSTSVTTRGATKVQSHLKLERVEKKQAVVKGAVVTRRMDESKMPRTSSHEARTDTTNINVTQSQEKFGHSKDYIACLLNEYGVLKRHGYQKNTKKFDWWPYEVLFSKIGPDLFSNIAPLNSGLVELYKDLRSVLVFNKCVESVMDLRKVALECEPCVMNITGSIASQLKLDANPASLQGSPTSRSLPAPTHVPYDVNVESMQQVLYGQNAHLAPGMNLNISQNNEESPLQLGFCQLVGHKTHRPTFVLAKFGSQSVWLSAAHVKSRRDGTTKLVLLDYIHTGSLEYEYLRRVLKSIYCPQSHLMAIPVLMPPEVDEAGETYPEVETINLSGFCWDLKPSVTAYLKNRLVTSDAPVEEGGTAHDEALMEIIDTKEIEDNALFSDPVSSKQRCFVTNQANALVGVLKAVNKAIDEHKSKLHQSLMVEHAYSKRLHEDKSLVEQYTKVATRMNRWSHFRRSIMQAVETFNNFLLHESRADDQQNKNEKVKAETVKDTTDKEFCSVCLMAEPAQKQMMHQCSRCFIRVHFKCYVSYKPTTVEPVHGTVKSEETVHDWFCDPCEYEVLMNANSRAATCNNAVCCVCYSSGGALKRVSEHAAKRNAPSMPVKWVHLHCAALLMPKVTCHDWVDLNKWDLRNSNASTTEKCSICTVSGGIMLHCARPGCNNKFHTTCAWVGGGYVVESPLHNATDLPGMVRNTLTFNELFPALSLRMLCAEHTAERFGDRAVTALMRRRCYAYTHYQYSPQNTNNDMKNAILPLKPCPSHIIVTRNGAMHSTPMESIRPKEEVLAPEPTTFEMVTKQRKLPMAHSVHDVMPTTASHGVVMNSHHPGMMMVSTTPSVMMNYPHGMMVNTAPSMIVNGGQHMLVNGGQHMVVNTGHHMMMGGGHPMMMNPHHPSMMNTQHTMMPTGMRKPTMAPLVYGTHNAYMNEQPRYGVSAIASHLSGGGYKQPMSHTNVNHMEVPMQHVMMPYVAPVTAVPINGGMLPVAQHPQYHHNGYQQPVQMVPKYWNPRLNQMQYKEQQPPPDNPYVGVGGMGYMEQ